MQNDKNVIVLPLSVLEELVAIPANVASPHGGLENDLLGTYTGLDLVLESRLHHSIIQRKLTPRLGLVTPGLEKELGNALTECLPNSEDWVVFQPYQAFSKVSARFSSQAITGPAFANNEEWLNIGVEYVETRKCSYQINMHLFATKLSSPSIPDYCLPAIDSRVDASRSMLASTSLLVLQWIPPPSKEAARPKDTRTSRRK